MKRSLSLDLIKLVAMFGVMCLHTEYCFYDNPLAQFLYMSAVVSIPIFFMASGYLLLGKEHVDYKYSLKKIYGILRFVAVMTIGFWLLSGYRHGIPFLEYTVGSLLQKGGLYVYWYFGSMVIIYALLPFLHSLYSRHCKAFFALTAGLCAVSNAIFISHAFGFQLEENTIQTFRLWNWLFYFNVGGVIRKLSQKRIGLWCVLVLFAVNYIFQRVLTPMMPTQLCEYFYASLPVMLLSIGLFIYMIGMDDAKLEFINGGGRIFLPCYTFHPFVIGHTYGIFNHVYQMWSYTAPLFWIAVSFISVILSLLIMKIPYMDKIFRV